MITKAGELTNFLDLFVYAAGTWKTPTHFHRWAGISLLAACLEDRVSLKVFDHAPLYPNLWCFLIGGSGVGKEHAVGHALSYLNLDGGDDADPLFTIDGKITVPSLYERMEKYQAASGRESAPVYLISSDVGEQLPLGPEAKDFTSRVLGLYGGRKRMLNDSTRMHGSKFVKGPLLNWVAGCTPQWFPNAIDPEVFHSGFAGRAFFIFGQPDERYEHMMKPMMPLDVQAVRDEIRRRLELYMRVEGVFELTKRARQVMDDWLVNRTKDSKIGMTDLEREVRGRQPTAVLKLAMGFAISDWTGKEPLKVKWAHVAGAISVVESLVEGLRNVGNFVYRNDDTRVLDLVRDTIKQHRSIQHSKLLRHATARGVKNKKHFQDVIDTLIQQDQIEVDVKRTGDRGRPSKVYKWRTSRGLRFLKNVKGDDESTTAEREDAEADDVAAAFAEHRETDSDDVGGESGDVS